MAIVLFGSRVSPFVEKVVRGLALKGLDFELRVPSSPFELRRWNRTTGKMPVLEIDGERVYDSSFILQRLEGLAPSPPLFAEEPATAAAQRLLEDWADEALYWYTMAFRWSRENAPASAREILGAAPALLRPVLVPMLTRRVAAATRAQGLGRLPLDVLEREYAARLDDLVRLLGDRPFFHAERPSAADLAVYGQLAMARSEASPQTRRAVAERPALLDYAKRVEEATGA